MKKVVATLMAVAAGIETATVTFNQLVKPVAVKKSKPKVGFNTEVDAEKNFVNPRTTWIN